jgi:hypothetical protein
MRTIHPECSYLQPDTGLKDRAYHKHSLFFDFLIPIRLFKERFLIVFFIERESLADHQSASVSSWKKRLNTVIVLIAVGCLLYIVFTGLVYFVYLLKCQMGYDLFPGAHFFK